jgi:membrane-bound lytic murein transglycosylase MltF
MRRFVITSILFVFVCIQFSVAATQAPAKEKFEMSPTQLFQKPWTGDLDGMMKRRYIRVLTVYSKTMYFLDKNTQRGTVYDSMKAFEEELNKKFKTGNLKTHVLFLPVSRDQLLKSLNEGKGDIVCANLTVTPERQQQVEFTAPVLRNVNEIVVTGPASPKIATLDDLSGQEVFVRKSSSYYQSLRAVNEDFKKQGKKEIILKPAPEELENEDLLEMLNAGLVKLVVVDDHIGGFWKLIFPKIVLHENVKVRSGGDIAWAIRKNSPKFLAELNSFVKTHGKGTAFGNTTLQKYLKQTKYVKSAGSEAERKKFLDLVSIFQKYGNQYRVDDLLMVAQGYQESQLNQNAKSKVGAVGIMQLMPGTGKDMNVGDINQVEPNINAGIKYMRFMMDQYYKDEPMTDLNKALFTFASYNAGPAKIRTLRKEAAKQGLDPNIWFNNVERVVSEKIGRETVTYVSNIYKYYIAYKLIIEEQNKREQLKKGVTQ